MNKNKYLKSNNNKNIVEKNKFYRIKANIIGTTLIHLPGFNKDYVEYTIEIKTDYGKYNFKKTYEDFYKLNNLLVNIFPKIKELFPPKRIFFKNSENITKERIKYFKKYLKILLNNINIFQFVEILNFLYMDKEIIGLFIKKYKMLNINEDNYIVCSLKEAFNKINNQTNNQINQIITKEETLSCLNNDNYYDAILEYEKKRQISIEWNEPSSVTPNTFVVREFLHNLSETIENKNDIILNFEKFLQKSYKWIKLSKNEILELFIGYDEYLEDEKENEVHFNRKRTFQNKDNKTIKSNLFNWINKKNSQNENDEEEDEEEENEESQIPGLFQQIGNYEKNVICAVGSLDLLEKLLNTEYNPDYEIYMNIFKSMKIFQFKYMKLNNIIKKNIGGNKTNIKAMKILNLIFSDKKFEEYIKEIITDENVFKQYKNYVNNIDQI